MSDQADIEEWLKTHQPTRCPTVALCPTTATPPRADLESIRKRDDISWTKRRPGRKIKSLVGARFGLLIVVAYDGKYSGGYWWRCVCDCGNKKNIASSNLKTGQTKSCGCLKTRKRK